MITAQEFSQTLQPSVTTGGRLRQIFKGKPSVDAASRSKLLEEINRELSELSLYKEKHDPLYQRRVVDLAEKIFENFSTDPKMQTVAFNLIVDAKRFTIKLRKENPDAITPEAQLREKFAKRMHEEGGSWEEGIKRAEERLAQIQNWRAEQTAIGHWGRHDRPLLIQLGAVEPGADFHAAAETKAGTLIQGKSWKIEDGVITSEDQNVRKAAKIAYHLGKTKNERLNELGNAYIKTIEKRNNKKEFEFEEEKLYHEMQSWFRELQKIPDRSPDDVAILAMQDLAEKISANPEKYRSMILGVGISSESPGPERLRIRYPVMDLYMTLEGAMVTLPDGRKVFRFLKREDGSPELEGFFRGRDSALGKTREQMKNKEKMGCWECHGKGLRGEMLITDRGGGDTASIDELPSHFSIEGVDRPPGLEIGDGALHWNLRRRLLEKRN